MATSTQADVARFGNLEVDRLRLVGESGSRMMATFSAAQTADFAVGDHFKFDVVTLSGGSLISLDTTTSYVTTANVASLGRFTLSASRTYRIIVHAGQTVFSANTGSMRFALFNSDANSLIFGHGDSAPQSSTFNGTGAPVLMAFYTTGASAVRVEVRVTVAGSMTSIGRTDTQELFPVALIENLN